MIGEWVLIFIQLSQSIPFGHVAVGVQPIYFQTKAACDAVAAEFNGGPEPSKDTPRNKQKSFGAICRPTAAQARETDMGRIPITEARKIAERFEADAVAIFAFKDGRFSATSYGATKAKCKATGEWLDALCNGMTDGVLAAPEI